MMNILEKKNIPKIKKFCDYSTMYKQQINVKKQTELEIEC